MCAVALAGPVWRKPITGIASCCAVAATGHATAPPSSVMNSRRFMSDMGTALAQLCAKFLRRH
jgi:hypothetical protein